MTRLLGVIGDPIVHSLSPLIHNGWLRDHGIGATYEAFQVKQGAFDTALETLKKRDLVGLNVTLPHKASALAAAREASDAAARIGAANTLSVLAGGALRADNTDAPGFLHALGPIDPLRDRAVVLGAGGSARAIVFALTKAGLPLTVLNRTESRAAELCRDLGGQTAQYGHLDAYTDYIESVTIVINTTSMGHDDEILALPDGEGRIFFDLSYGKVSRRQLAHAEGQGWSVQDGLSMLVAQAAYSFEIWFGMLPDLESGMKRCRMALKAST